MGDKTKELIKHEDNHLELAKEAALRHPDPIIQEDEVSCIVTCHNCGNDKFFRLEPDKYRIVRMRATLYWPKENEIGEVLFGEDISEPANEEDVKFSQKDWDIWNSNMKKDWDIWFICTKCGHLWEDYNILTLA